MIINESSQIHNNDSKITANAVGGNFLRIASGAMSGDKWKSSLGTVTPSNSSRSRVSNFLIQSSVFPSSGSHPPSTKALGS